MIIQKLGDLNSNHLAIETVENGETSGKCYRLVDLATAAGRNLRSQSSLINFVSMKLKALLNIPIRIGKESLKMNSERSGQSA